MKVQWRYIIAKDLDRFVGQTRKGLLFTVSGLLAGAHLGGHGKLWAYLKSNRLLPDGNGVFVTEYIKNFGGNFGVYSSKYLSRGKFCASCNWVSYWRRI
jgi:hypothetical protein